VVVQPRPAHRFLDTAGIALQSLAIGAQVFDAYESKRALAQPGTREANPVLRNNALIVVKLVGVAAEVGIAAALHKTGHHRAERWLPVLFAVPSFGAGIHNATMK
jgi:hypothetical protein